MERTQNFIEIVHEAIAKSPTEPKSTSSIDTGAASNKADAEEPNCDTSKLKVLKLVVIPGCQEPTPKRDEHGVKYVKYHYFCI